MVDEEQEDMQKMAQDLQLNSGESLRIQSEPRCTQTCIDAFDNPK